MIIETERKRKIMKIKRSLYFLQMVIYMVILLSGCSEVEITTDFYDEISTTVETEKKIEVTDKKESSEIESSQQEIKIEDSLETIEETAESDEIFIVKDGVLLAYNGTSKEVIIPEGVTSIVAFAFMDHELTKVKIPASVTSIDANAFFGNSWWKKLSEEERLEFRHYN